MPLPLMKALKPTTPRSASSGRRATLPGTSPPQSAKSVRAVPRAAATLASNDAASSVGGDALSGMSTNSVPPPAANAVEPVANPSQSARPGSLKWTCGSTTPGSTWQPAASIVSTAGPAISGATSAIRPSAIAISMRTGPAGPTTIPPRIRASHRIIQLPR
jgi:hypothetical protein